MKPDLASKVHKVSWDMNCVVSTEGKVIENIVDEVCLMMLRTVFTGVGRRVAGAGNNSEYRAAAVGG